MEQISHHINVVDLDSFKDMYKHLASLKTEANKSKNYRERNERTVIKKHKSVATLPESILTDTVPPVV